MLRNTSPSPGCSKPCPGHFQGWFFLNAHRKEKASNPKPPLGKDELVFGWGSSAVRKSGGILGGCGAAQRDAETLLGSGEGSRGLCPIPDPGTSREGDAQFSWAALPWLFPLLQMLICLQCSTGMCCGIFGVTMPKLRPLFREDLLLVPALPPALGTAGLGFHSGPTQAEQFGMSGQEFLSQCLWDKEC